MKNIVIFDKDTERDEKILISKPDIAKQPSNKDEAKAMIIEDISTATEGLITLVRIGGDSGYIDSKKSAELIIKYLTEGFLVNNKE